MKKVISIFLIFVLIFSLCSCTQSNTVDKPLKMGVLKGAKTFDPIIASTDAEKIISTNCFEGLLRFDSKSKIDLSGAIGYTVSSDNLTYTFKLNPDARWHIDDNVKAKLEELKLKKFSKSIVAEDYIFGFENYIKNSKDQLYSIEGAEAFKNKKAKNVSGLKAIDKFTLQITLNKIDPDFVYKLATLPLYPCDKAFYKATGKGYGKDYDGILYNGAYFVEKVKDKKITLKRNKQYKGKLQVRNGGVELLVGKDLEQLEKQFLKNKTHIYIAPSYKVIEGDTTSFSETKSTWGIAFNCKSPSGSIKELRDILLSSIHYDNIDRPFFSNSKAETIIPKNYTVGDSNYGDFEPNTINYPENPGNAQKNIDALLLSRGVSSFKVNLFVPEPLKKTAEEMVENWRILFQDKIKVEISDFELSQSSKIAKEGKYDMAILPLEAQDKTAFGVIEQIKGAPCYYENKILTSLMSYIKATNEENASICTRAEKFIVDNGVFVPLFFDSNELYQAENVRGVFIANGGGNIYLHSGEIQENEK